MLVTSERTFVVAIVDETNVQIVCWQEQLYIDITGGIHIFVGRPHWTINQLKRVDG